MNRQSADPQKIPLSAITLLILIFLSMLGFSTAVVYSMSRLQYNIQDNYIQPLMVNNAGLEAYKNLSRLHNHMTKIMLNKGSNPDSNLAKEMVELDKELSNYFSTIKTEFRDDTEKILQIEQQLENWKNIRIEMIRLVGSGRKDQALKLASSRGAPAYRQLESSMGQIVNSSQQQIETRVNAANIRSSEIIHLIWWLLGGFILTSIISGFFVIRKITRTLEYHKQAERKLHESKERMKLALSGADVGTWDLDPVSGKLDFDSQWGGLLNYIAENERPHSMKDWAALIHPGDKERVLKAMQEHIDGRANEYKAEYRIYSRSGILKWVIGHGKAVQRDKKGKALRVVGITRDITMQKQAEDTIWKLAHTDSLTGLPNRSLFYDRLGQCIAQARRQHKQFALLFLDLDDFKQVNDTFGHDTGDLLLQGVAERLRQNIRDENTVARTGGDEFILILNDIANAESAAIVAQKIIQSISDPFVIHGHSCQIGSSIGIAIFPDDSEELEKLVTHADSAMYKAKQSGKNNYRFFASNV
ncbi:MAG: hypothetical protein B7Y56_11325 [Gallionellales bacterium 35-53-114]|jgi:diguanylate cyclase (GGDEF)-like protein|nr:MAG: hypothetical protein B7Y56_11325 [Gallionellales bacterium 35-53-114]OYZ64795.1 MAG: hypothetical protein B7Y04_03275 [Gallionellales bacterium 24-53-125]OZB07666.1 MAG: hypothetical protein B7X61_13740 [Gallionellales bacterium 39-52-133]HQS58641.1 diguanylate cyclase [Gallionellaceae bacterium]HQS74982.1 diguanylate cyclase [Gallionellaceae bacterium]